MKTTGDRVAFLTFIQTFFDDPLRERWTYICQKGKNRWSALDPYALWTKSELGSRCSHDFPGTHIGQAFDIYGLAGSRDQVVSVVCFGHAVPQMYEATLAEAITGDRVPFEGLVLVEPKELVFCFTHEGEVRVFESKARRHSTKGTRGPI